MRTDERAAARAPGSARIEGLDVLRTLAVAAVIAYHLGWAVGGWVGVDVFFVLSGYLITGLLLRDRPAGRRVGLAGFWGRRARRLLPAALVCIAGTIALGVWLEPGAVATWSRTGTGAALWAGNWQQILAGGSYFDAFGAPNALKHLWSLSVEEQLYVAWPLVVLAVTASVARRRHHHARTQALTVATAALALTALSVAVMWRLAPGPHGDPTRVWYGTDTRAMTPLVGAALAAVISAFGWPRGRRGRLALDVAGGLGFVALVVVTVAVDDHAAVLWHGGSLAIAVAAAALVAATAQPGWLRRQLARPRALAWIGAALSYALYLWHWPVIVLLTPARAGIDGLPLDALRIAVAFALATLSWALVERPIRSGVLRPRLSGRPATVLALGAVALVVVAGTGVALTRPTVGEQMAALAAHGPGGGAAGSQVVLAPALTEPPVAAAPPAPMRVSLYGDSVAWSYSVDVTPGVLAAHDTAAVYNHSDWFCQLFDAPRREGATVKPAGSNCAGWAQAWPQQVAADRPSVALLSVGVWEVFDRELGGQWESFGTPAFDQQLGQSLDGALSILGSTGARVALTTSPYPERHPGEGESPPEWTQEGGGRARFDHLNALLRAAAARHGAQVVDLGRYWCPTADGPCRPGLRYDGVHFQPDTSSPQVFGWILDQLAAGAPPASAPTG